MQCGSWQDGRNVRNGGLPVAPLFRIAEGGYYCGDYSREDADAEEHEEYRGELAYNRYGVVVAVADRGNRY